MTLLIEVTPTRFKYARWVDGRLEGLETLTGGSSAAEPPWASALARLAPTPQSVHIANGAGAVFRSRLSEWIRRAWHIDPVFLEPLVDADGPLPMERGLALAGARAQGLLPSLVVTSDAMVGIDLLDSQGRRIGAWTLPGERPMHEALYAQTSGVAAAALLDPAAVEGGFGVNTSGAVQAGSRLAISSCVAAIARGQPERVRVIATGRFAIEAVRQLMPDALIMDDLAMQGLAHALAEASS
jgi:hypothetical protein